MASPHYLDIIEQAHHFDRSELVSHKWHDLTFMASGEEADHIWNTVRGVVLPCAYPKFTLILGPADCLYRLQRPAPHKNPERAETLLLCRGEQVVTPGLTAFALLLGIW